MALRSRRSPSFEDKKTHVSPSLGLAVTKSLIADPTRPEPPVTITTDGVVVSVAVLVSSDVMLDVVFVCFCLLCLLCLLCSCFGRNRRYRFGMMQGDGWIFCWFLALAIL